MATTQKIIERALRKLGSLGAGATPRTVDLDDGLDAFKALLRRWITDGKFGVITSVIPNAGEFTAGENQHVFLKHPTTVVNLPETVPNYGLGTISDYGEVIGGVVIAQDVDSSSRPPRNGAIVRITDPKTATTTDPQTQDYIYDSSISAWVQIEALALSMTAPFSMRDASGLAACLAVELADEYGLPIGPTTTLQAARFESGLMTDWSSDTQPITPVSYV